MKSVRDEDPLEDLDDPVLEGSNHEFDDLYDIIEELDEGKHDIVLFLV